MDIARSMLGVAVLLLLAYAISNNRKAIRAHMVIPAWRRNLPLVHWSFSCPLAGVS